MKYFLTGKFLRLCRVAPLTGAWIEIMGTILNDMDQAASLPSRERGLKYPGTTHSRSGYKVAPLTGAWIEITMSLNEWFNYWVAPLTGAWIEIKEPPKEQPKEQRRSPHGSVD